VHANAGAQPFDFPVSLTRFEFDPSAMIGEAADMLAELMSGTPPAEAVRRVAAKLVEGESC
jgi:DNA-binding LacI/PurR family transcriptional regulator